MSKQPKYKVGDKVRVVNSTHYPTPSTAAMVGTICTIESYRPFDGIYGVGKNDYAFRESDLAPVKKTLRDMQAGDILVANDGDEAKVLVILAEVFFTSTWGSLKEAGYWYTFEEAEEMGFKLKGTTPQETPPTVSVSNIEPQYDPEYNHLINVGINCDNQTAKRLAKKIERLVGLEEA